jgi:arylsulfatase A-like enzyme
MATIAAILGHNLPDHAAEDSVSILPALLGEPLREPLREATVHHSARGKFAIRQGDWVLIDAPSGDDNGANGEPSWLKDERGYLPHEQPGELYNLSEDISQRNNLYASKPALVQEMKSLLEKYIQEGRSTPGIPQSNDAEIKPYSAVGAQVPPKKSRGNE